MVNLRDYFPSNELEDYLKECWHVLNAENATNGSVLANGPLESEGGSQSPLLILPMDALDRLFTFQTPGKNPQFIRFSVYAMVFGENV